MASCEPTRPASEATFTMRAGAALLHARAAPRGSPPARRAGSRRSRGPTGPRSVRTKKSSSAMPALFTSTSIGPSSASAAATAAPTDSRERTSSSTPRPSSSAASSRARSRSRSATATRAPSAASREQVAAPMPPVPPVTSAISSLEPHGPATLSRPVASAPLSAWSPSRSSAAPARWASAWRCAWPRPGRPVAIGSRDAGRAEEAAARVREQVPDAQVEGLENAEAARAGRSCS